MANETLSPSQANEIIRKSVDVQQNIERMIHMKSSDFLKELSRIWEDQHAVDFAVSYQASFKNTFSELESNFKKFHDNVSEIVRKYATVSGNSASISVLVPRVNSEVEIGAVHDHFLDSENEDEFGFKNGKSVEELEYILKGLTNSLEHVSEQAASDINHINAFGNTGVQNGLAKSAGNIVEILKTQIENVKKTLFEKISETMQEYILAGELSVTASSLIAATHNGNLSDLMEFGDNISTLYGGVTPPTSGSTGADEFIHPIGPPSNISLLYAPPTPNLDSMTPLNPSGDATDDGQES